MTWVKIKVELKKKYILPIFRDRLLDKLSSLKQGNMTVKEYMNKFDELVVRCDIQENSRLTLSRFRTGLRPTLQREMLQHTVESVDEAFQLALGIETYLQTPSDRKSAFKVREQPKQQFENNDKPNTTVSKDVKDKTVTGESSQQVTKGDKCFKCHGYGHFAYQCPTRSLLLDEVHNDKDHELLKRLSMTLSGIILMLKRI